MSGVLTGAQLAVLTAAQDRLIPREGEVPGAGEAGAAERVDGYLAERRDWRAGILAALQAIEVASERVQRLRPFDASDVASTGFLGLSGDERDAVLQAVEASHPLLFQRLLRLTYTAYYADGSVQRVGGFEAEPPLPRGNAVTMFDESRLEAVKRRGKRWRDA